jgi:hypothetical protein
MEEIDNYHAKATISCYVISASGVFPLMKKVNGVFIANR